MANIDTPKYDYLSRGNEFRDSVAALLRAAKYEVTVETLMGSKRVDVLCEARTIGKKHILAVECKYTSRPLEKTQVVQIYAEYSGLWDDRQIDEIMLVTQSDISAAAKAFVREKRNFTHVTFFELQAQIIDFTPYLRALIAQYEEDGLHEHYIENRLENGSTATQYLLNWLENADAPPLALLGGYGMGKTTTARSICVMLARKILKGDVTRIPVYIQLQDISGEQTLEGLLGRTLTSRWTVRNYHFDSFSILNRSARLLVVLDGFDEMKHLMTWEDFRYNFRQLNRMVVPDAKVVILGRPSAFLSESERVFVLKGQRLVAGQVINEPDWPKYEEHYLEAFSESESKDYIKKYTNYRLATRKVGEDYLVSYDEYLKRFNQLPEIKQGDLLNRPVQTRMFAEMVLDSSVELRAFSIAELYKVFIDRIIERECEKLSRNSYNPRERRDFVRRLAWWMWNNDRRSNLHTDKIPQNLIEKFRKSSNDDFDAIKRDLVTACFLEHKSGDVLFFPHLSFQEFLVAEYLNSTEESIPFGVYVNAISSEVLKFIEGMPTESLFAKLFHGLQLYKGEIPFFLLSAIANSDAARQAMSRPFNSHWQIAISIMQHTHPSVVRIEQIFATANGFRTVPGVSGYLAEVALMAVSLVSEENRERISRLIIRTLFDQLELDGIGDPLDHRKDHIERLAKHKSDVFYEPGSSPLQKDIELRRSYRNTIRPRSLAVQIIDRTFDFQIVPGTVTTTPKIQKITVRPRDLYRELKEISGPHIVDAECIERLPELSVAFPDKVTFYDERRLRLITVIFSRAESDTLL